MEKTTLDNVFNYPKVIDDRYLPTLAQQIDGIKSEEEWERRKTNKQTEYDA